MGMNKDEGLALVQPWLRQGSSVQEVVYDVNNDISITQRR